MSGRSPSSTPPTVHRSPCSLFTPPQGPRFPCPFPHHTRGAFRRSPLTPGTGPSPAPLVLPPVGLSLRSRPPVGRTAPRVSVTREGAGPPVKRASRETDGLWLVPLSLTRLSRSSPGLIPPLVTLAAQREGREPTGRTRSESGREVSDRHAERRGGRRECKTEPHVVPLSLRFGSLRPLVTLLTVGAHYVHRLRRGGMESEME